MSLLVRVVAAFEGFKPEIYADPVGIPTVGYGHLIIDGETFATPLSPAAGLLLLESDLAVARKAVDRLFRGVYLSESEWDALTSFVFNVGEGNLAGSNLRKKAQAGDRLAASHEFVKWVYATRKTQNGNVKVKLPGLVRRRDIESIWFLGADEGTVGRLAGVELD